MSELISIIPSAWLFRFVVPVCYHPQAGKCNLPEWLDAYELPQLGSITGSATFSRVWAAWSEHGLTVALAVCGRHQEPGMRSGTFGTRDYTEIYINTRPGADVHRVNRYCHAFRAFPGGLGFAAQKPTIERIALTDEDYWTAPRVGQAKVIASVKGRDYALCIVLPAKALTGFQPDHEPRVGFMYAIFDQCLGVQTFTGTSPSLLSRDPSLWTSLELVRQETTGA